MEKLTRNSLPRTSSAGAYRHVPQGENWRAVPTELWPTQRNNRHSSAYRRLHDSSDTGRNYFHPTFNRLPSPREAARLLAETGTRRAVHPSWECRSWLRQLPRL